MKNESTYKMLGGCISVPIQIAFWFSMLGASLKIFGILVGWTYLQIFMPLIISAMVSIAAIILLVVAKEL